MWAAAPAVSSASTVPVVGGQAHDAVFNVQLVFAHNGHTAFEQQFVVMEQAAGYGVLNGCKSHQAWVAVHGVEQGFEGVGIDHVERLALTKVLVGGNVVERTFDALNDNSFHNAWKTVCNKKSRLS